MVHDEGFDAGPADEGFAFDFGFDGGTDDAQGLGAFAFDGALVPGVGVGDAESDGGYLGHIDDWGKTDAERAEAAAAREAEEAARPLRPAAERTAELMERMVRQRHVLRAILGACEEVRLLEAVREQVADVQARYRSIHTLENLLALLEEAGSLERVTEDGAPYVWDPEAAEPTTVVIDGVEYLENPEPPAVFWKTTEVGLQALANTGATARLEALFEREGVYLPIYKRVLLLCSEEGGASMPSLGAAVDKDPLVQKPRFYAAHFVDALEAADAVVWDGGWVTTDAGREALEMLADVRDDAPAKE